MKTSYLSNEMFEVVIASVLAVVAISAAMFAAIALTFIYI